MAIVSNFFGKYPCDPKQKKPVHITKEKMIHYIYTPEDPHMSDLNWMFASTQTLFSGRYHLAAGSSFDPPDVHAGDEYYYVLNGTFTMFNPATGQVVEIKKGECINLPKGAPHKAYNFGMETAEVLYLIVPSVWEDGESGPPPYDDSIMEVLIP
jgi:mannose-6-phosphate isomerase-like protein (cupin superfamily)